MADISHGRSSKTFATWLLLSDDHVYHMGVWAKKSYSVDTNDRQDNYHNNLRTNLLPYDHALRFQPLNIKLPRVPSNRMTLLGRVTCLNLSMHDREAKLATSAKTYASHGVPSPKSTFARSASLLVVLHTAHPSPSPNPCTSPPINTPDPPNTIHARVIP
ncbi:hypothetical protein BU23DRAFT_565453 [Bimuria novae-zelandiae CBS 107.79]|uniref:Uncharacterized protein n=1 Tax=Bimuria novae-zelandiae CBS 107.79 TaxID=1447943 RepID=A0A6A5VJZ9_9PLEO|nr:hypothetical protein BU23DRAFT_565453 [Bimuria novae-zelandiae CBS 107.79]